MIGAVRSFFSTLRSNPTLSAVVAEGFLARLGFGVITFALPFYAFSLGMSLSEVGILASLRLVAAIVVKPVMGYAADRFGKKNVYVWSIAGRTLVGLLFSFATTPWELYAVRTLHGVTTAARDPSSAFLIAEHGEEKKMASSFAWYTTAKEVGASVGYMMAGLLLTLTHDHYLTVFLFSVLTSALSLWLTIRYVSEHPFRDHPQEETLSASPVPRKVSWLHYASLAVMIAACGNMVTYLFPLIATQHNGLTKGECSVIIGFSSMAIMFAGPFFGWFSDNISRRAVLSFRSAANSVSSLLYLLPGFWGTTSARLSDDLGKAAFRPAWGSLITNISASAETDKRGRMIAYLDTAQSLGEGIGPALAGILWDWYGIYWMFGIRLALAVATEIYAILLMR